MNDLRLPTCPICKKGHLQPSNAHREFHPNGHLVRVELLASRCDHCGGETIRAGQHDENLRRLAERKVHYGGLLMGEEIVALRKRYGLTQQAAARIFGKGKIAFSRYENEVTYPDESMTLLIKQAIKRPEVLKDLADEADVEIPLWQRRCEDERSRKVRTFAVAASQPVKLQALPMARFTGREAGNETFAWSPEAQQA